MKLKVCGMNHNTQEVAKLQPDYLGFIFWEPSKRSFTTKMPIIDPSIKKVGVFVDASLEEVIEKVKLYNLDAVQLHGKETPVYCNSLRQKHVEHDNFEIIKVFSIKDDFDFSIIEPYEEVCDYYLFDTKGKLPGGNGYTFNWSVLKNYPSTKPYFLSGGIGLENVTDIESFQQLEESKYCHAIDINSKFETEPGLKNIEKLTKFKNKLTSPL
ncbi:MAG: N-(5'-phosphoribosyl)anthranilate isomerase [Flavobacteriaceae bacterium]|nr:MAG: N-(5'-phosphoribosyl)anthranilate isomerase [Flavobacteriaceae bacterium]